jgi:serine protease Do
MRDYKYGGFNMAFNVKTKLGLGALALAAFIAGVAVSGTLNITPLLSADESAGDLEALRNIGTGFSAIAKEVSPSVVNVSVSRTIKNSFHGFDFFGGGPFEDFFGFPAPKDDEYLIEGAGSGVIVSKDGYILTNNHVVESAEEITVRTYDGKEYDGELIGTDPRTDLAVIKVDGNNLPAAELGNSDEIEVGEWVLAIGNPFQLSHTVTAGIVSAKGRANVGLADYEDFIQTDAAINPGNSGGALVNLEGEVIGINTAIATRTGVYSGVGFAIPINMAKAIMEQLIKTGKVTRGWLGLYIQPITPELKEQFDLPNEDGALVSEVVKGGPSEKAGLERGDVVIEFNGTHIRDSNQLRMMAAGTEIGTKVKVKVIRDGREKVFTVKIGELPEEDVGGVFEPRSSEQKMSDKMGFSVKNLNDAAREQLGLEPGTKGVVVDSVKQTSDAYQNGLRRGDVIVEVDGEPVNDVNDYEANVLGLDEGDKVLLLVITGGHTRYVTFEIGG